MLTPCYARIGDDPQKKTNVYTLIHKLKSLYYYDYQKKLHCLHNLGSKKEDNEIANYK
jgi:hypothetical protein